MENEELQGERQYPKVFNEAAADHQERYHLALRFIKRDDVVLDAACGVGYGSHYIATNSGCRQVVAVDVSDSALDWARRYYSSDKVVYCKADLSTDFSTLLPVTQYDVITCFETLEHLKEDRIFLRRIRELLKPDGVLLISAPNEDVIPHNKNPFYKGGVNPFHFRHYTTAELAKLAEDCGLYPIDYYTQALGAVVRGQGAFVNILVCQTVPGQGRVIDDLDSILAECILLKDTSNQIADALEFITLRDRFGQLLSTYRRLWDAVSLLGEGRFDECLDCTAKIDETMCPERVFVAGMAYEGKFEYGRALDQYAKVIALERSLKPALVSLARRRFAENEFLGSQTTLESITEHTINEWEIAVTAERFIDPNGIHALSRLLVNTDADIIYVPVVYELIERHPIARWEVIAKRKSARTGKEQRVSLRVRGDSPSLPYMIAYEHFSHARYNEALVEFVQHFNSARTREDKAVYLRWICLCLVELSRDGDALNILKDAVRMYPDNTDLLYLQATVQTLAGFYDAIKTTTHRIYLLGDSTNFPEYFYNIRQLALALDRDSCTDAVGSKPLF